MAAQTWTGTQRSKRPRVLHHDPVHTRGEFSPSPAPPSPAGAVSPQLGRRPAGGSVRGRHPKVLQESVWEPPHFSCKRGPWSEGWFRLG